MRRQAKAVAVARTMDAETIRALLVAGLLALSMLTLASCNTVEGFGEDVEGAGDAVEDTADDTEDDL